jgi:predicted dehydrogenase
VRHGGCYHAASNSQLTAFVSGDRKKLQTLSRRYKVSHTYSYEQYDQCLREGHIDAVYISLPNSMHCEYATRAAKAGIHVLCEKPMAVPEQECRQMISAAERARTKLMIAYRLHFEEANGNAVELAQSGKLGKLRMFNSTFYAGPRRGYTSEAEDGRRPSPIRISSVARGSSFQINDAAKANGAAAIQPRPTHQELGREVHRL